MCLMLLTGSLIYRLWVKITSFHFVYIKFQVFIRHANQTVYVNLTTLLLSIILSRFMTLIIASFFLECTSNN